MPPLRFGLMDLSKCYKGNLHASGTFNEALVVSFGKADMQAVRFGDLFKSTNRQKAQAKFVELEARDQAPRMGSILVDPNGSQLHVVATGLDRLKLEGFVVFNERLADAFTRIGKDRFRHEQRDKPFDYREAVETYLENNTELRLLAEDTLKSIRKAIDLDA